MINSDVHYLVKLMGNPTTHTCLTHRFKNTTHLYIYSNVALNGKELNGWS